MSEVSREALRAFIEAQDENTIHAALGIRIVSFDPNALTLEVDVDARLFQHAGIVHGGVFVLLGESAASCAAAFEVDIARQQVAGMEVNANHLRPVTAGVLRAVARPVHKGKSTLVYGFEVSNDDQLCSVGRVTIAIRPRSEPV